MREWFGYFLGVCVILLSIPNFVLLMVPPFTWGDGIIEVLSGILCLGIGLYIISDQHRHNRRCGERAS